MRGKKVKITNNHYLSVYLTGLVGQSSIGDNLRTCGLVDKWVSGVTTGHRNR